jgi:hypothetical protein
LVFDLWGYGCHLEGSAQIPKVGLPLEP